MRYFWLFRLAVSHLIDECHRALLPICQFLLDFDVSQCVYEIRHKYSLIFQKSALITEIYTLCLTKYFELIQHTTVILFRPFYSLKQHSAMDSYLQLIYLSNWLPQRKPYYSFDGDRTFCLFLNSHFLVREYWYTNDPIIYRLEPQFSDQLSGKK